VTLERSRALWSRSGLDLASDEVIAQLLDRGDVDDWRALYGLAARDSGLRARIHRVVMTVPLPLPRFWLAALVALGEPVDLAAPIPSTRLL
jgi:hypothetical protein